MSDKKLICSNCGKEIVGHSEVCGECHNVFCEKCSWNFIDFGVCYECEEEDEMF